MVDNVEGVFFRVSAIRRDLYLGYSGDIDVVDPDTADPDGFFNQSGFRSMAWGSDGFIYALFSGSLEKIDPTLDPFSSAVASVSVDGSSIVYGYDGFLYLTVGERTVEKRDPSDLSLSDSHEIADEAGATDTDQFTIGQVTHTPDWLFVSHEQRIGDSPTVSAAYVDRISAGSMTLSTRQKIVETDGVTGTFLIHGPDAIFLTAKESSQVKLLRLSPALSTEASRDSELDGTVFAEDGFLYDVDVAGEQLLRIDPDDLTVERTVALAEQPVFQGLFPAIQNGAAFVVVNKSGNRHIQKVRVSDGTLLQDEFVTSLAEQSFRFIRSRSLPEIVRADET